jgi:ribosome biogenesis GTPase
MHGLVVKNSGSWYLVKTDAGRLVECKIKGNFRIKDIRTTNPIAIGDRVLFEPIDDVSGLIYEICDRQNYIIRRASNLSKHAHVIAANLDLAALVVTIKNPITYTIFIDRFLATAEAYRIPACLIFNKIDCYDEDDFQYLRAIAHLYTSLGYPVFEVSALQPETLTVLIDFLEGKINLFSGNSGVGKSTLIKAILPDVDIKIGDISLAHSRGMHTTTLSEMYALANGGYIIDTPGIKGFGIVDMEKDEIGHYFVEIFAASKNCRFNSCRHIHEPECAVRKAVEKHEISQSRYQSYLNILEDCDSGKYR